MSSDENEFGPFGKMKSLITERSLARRLVTVVLFLFVGLLLAPAFVGWSEFYINFLERERPIISIPDPPSGVGLEPRVMSVKVTDRDSGLDEVIIRSEQDDDIKEILKKRYPQKTGEDTMTFDLPSKKTGLRAGQVRIIITAFDRSFWSNRRQFTVELNADYTPPRIEVLTFQHNAVLGGVEFIFYRVSEPGQSFSWITVGEGLYPGFPAKELDKDFEQRPDIYFALFPIPLHFREATDKISVYAKDEVGNSSTASFYYRIRDVGVPTRTITLSRELLEAKLPPLLKQYAHFEAKVRFSPIAELPLPENDTDWAQRFRFVNQEYREMLENWLKVIFSRPKASRFWRGKFLHPAGTILSTFGERRSYLLNGVDAGSRVDVGVDLGSTLGTDIRAANSGIVIFSDELGVFGQLVVIDHGFGLTSLYGNLSARNVAEGDRIEKAKLIGKSGSSGLAFRDEVHFEMRLHGVPVRSSEWLDGRWIEDHIEQKIREVKKSVGIKTATPLPEGL